MMLIKFEKSKPVEKRGRKAKGLKLQMQWWQPVAEDKIAYIFASLAQNQALFVETLHSSTDKGKPVEKRRRKAIGSKTAKCSHDSQVADEVPERVSEIIAGSLSVFIELEKNDI